MTLPCKVEQYMDRHRMLDGCDTVVAAVSGGADSTAMLRMLKDLCARRGRALVCAHFNHSLRGADSDADEAFVRELCLQFQIPFFSEKRDVRALGGNLESSAREVRYAFLQRTAAGFPARADRHGAHHERQRRNRAVPYVARRGRAGYAGHRPCARRSDPAAALPAARGD